MPTAPTDRYAYLFDNMEEDMAVIFAADKVLAALNARREEQARRVAEVQARIDEHIAEHMSAEQEIAELEARLKVLIKQHNKVNMKKHGLVAHRKTQENFKAKTDAEINKRKGYLVSKEGMRRLGKIQKEFQ